MSEKDLKKLIEEQSEDIKVPDSLQPEFVVTQLEERAKKHKWAYYKKVMAAAACCTVIAGVGVVAAVGFFGKDGGVGGKGALALSEEAAGEAQNKNAAGFIKSESIAVAKDYEEIYDYIEAENKARNSAYEYAGNEKSAMATAEADQAAADGAAGSAYADSGAAYSDTNVREEGVGEGDIVKTDGKRLYILNNRSIKIVDITQDEMEEVGDIQLEKDIYVSEIFVKEDRLIAVYTQTEYSEDTDSERMMYGSSFRQYAVAETFDISDPQKPKSIGKVSQSGNYHSMRIVGDYVYLISNFYPDFGCTRADVDAYVPIVQGKRMESADIFMPSLKKGGQYTVISSFSLKDPEEKVDNKAVFGTSGLCYVSSENIYICETDYSYEDSDVNQTWIRKISYKDGKLKAVGQVKLNGVLNDSFSIDEYKGNLRLVMTVYHNGNNGVMPIPFLRDQAEESTDTEEKDTNVLYILDEDLNELSRIEGLAPDEQVYSARFMGDTGYFVTFKQIDPLFSVDLSDPENPEVLGELKIPGFSEYLHPYGDGQLLGIGTDVDETGTTANGVKLSMFDISNPKDVKEVQKYVLEDTYSTDVIYNYKAALIDEEKNLIGFAAYGEEQNYYIFSYGEDGFSTLMERELTGFSSNVRAMYAGERLYLVAGNTVESYQMGTFDKIDDIVL